ncbi:MAG: aminopeptidase, partial [Chitinophagales bacterium]|nr:aminopeptidase [Chitinophagales bacterium]
NDEEDNLSSGENYKIYRQAQQKLNQIYFERIGNGSLRRCLCQYPTPAAAADAGMNIEEYENFVFNACFLYEQNPAEKWLEIRRIQQRYVEYLDKVEQMQFIGPNIDISFSVKGRKWINSDGRANMPSGEVFSAPIENSVNGKVYFSYPTIFMGKEVEGIELEVKDGKIISWDAEKGKELLDKVFAIPGARYWGEVAIGTNFNISRATRNILFDEKIVGSIHMAVGQSYKQCGGKNESSIHWDMITDMRNGGQIYADGVLIYQNGEFLI